ncbi:membrane protein DedA with SNARE-associated domain [Diaminobutyricimonas aerilata]|uniref:Membrane protein DedA with SNARE-associated domain n=1 Tax=Diaminobutyricimonas aerilata TaxID=1162967 RepID=A0A2M9CL25_9MICO|nr:VTT domain-containing protein [Diaminobutyricimonas aerilata]PJJ72587.1 membrane protein DedA with SNARE-associated domain [Diaminobutyricimonas aerilata]
MDQVTDAVLTLLGSPWLYPVLFAITALDALLIVVPSETVVVALGATAASSGVPDLRIVVPVAAAAAMLGDNLGYLVGRSVGIDRARWMRRAAIARAFAWARRALDRRAAVVILTARFVPFGRLAVNLTAGATGFPVRRFVPLTIIAGSAWALYNVAVGAFFGAWLQGQPVLAVVVSVVVAVSLGIAVDAISSRLTRRTDGAAPGPPARTDGPSAANAPD